MNGKFFICLIIVCIFFMNGCMKKRVNLLETGTFLLAVMPSDDGVNILNVVAYRENGVVTVSGIVKRRLVSNTSPGHIDFYIHSQTGNKISFFSTYFYPRIIRRKGAKQGSFKVSLSSAPSYGSMIHLAFHKSDFSSHSKKFDCGNNMADPANMKP